MKADDVTHAVAGTNGPTKETATVNNSVNTPAMNPAVNTCPLCGSRLGTVNLYCGGRGYLSYDICQNPGGCDYQRRA